jgi:hypothetical protein
MANPPPPYDSITGISRTVMKDNAQETLTNYNGNARPGEIVADLTTDPPALYVGNNLGALTAIAAGGAAFNLIENGDSNVTIAVPNGNITVSANTQTWTFATTGTLSAPGNITAIGLQGDGNLVIRSNVAGTARTWTFDSLGDLNLPLAGNISGSGYVTAQRMITDPQPLTNLTAVAGARAFVSDGNLVAAGNFGAQIGSGGANTVPVWSDGANWYVG